jgi:hypothetical protein
MARRAPSGIAIIGGRCLMQPRKGKGPVSAATDSEAQRNATGPAFPKPALPKNQGRPARAITCVPRRRWGGSFSLRVSR